VVSVTGLRLVEASLISLKILRASSGLKIIRRIQIIRTATIRTKVIYRIDKLLPPVSLVESSVWLEGVVGSGLVESALMFRGLLCTFM
jgi:hypothetical protein